MLKELIKKVEDHTGEKFDLNNRRHFFQLNEKIKRLHADKLRKLWLIEKAMQSNKGENEIYDNRSHYLQKRFKD